MARQLLGVVVAMLALRLVVADLPIHCLNVQVAGKWVFEMGKDDGDNKLKCGHKVPDTNLDHFTKHGFDLEVVKTYELDLQEPNIVVDTKGNRGTWTMIYDEGFEVVIAGLRFFAFNKYVPKSPESLTKDAIEDYISICDETLVGWFHKQDGTHWGCYHGKKTANTSKPMRFSRVDGGNSQELTKVLAPDAMSLAPMKAPSVSGSRISARFDDDDLEKLDHDPVWEPDYSFVETWNSDEGKTWRASVHRHFVGNRVSQMMRLLGGRVVTGERPATKKYKKSGSVGSQQDKRPDAEKYAGLPESFDWRSKDGANYDSPVKNQGNCGSCYAMASISVAEARIRIQTKNAEKPLLSSQHVVSCSIYNQGCDGGYPYLVGKHAQDFGLYEDSCMSYTAANTKCKRSCPGKKWVATNYSYIGGYYGGCSEVAMMKELYEKGPIMVAFDAPSDLFYYSGGVYTGAAPPHEGPKFPNLNWWEKTNHAVVAVGWGVDKGVKYWIIKNTWGEQWGEKGYFRIKRGTDECGVESMASFMDIAAGSR